jgi:hypothetical protein
MSQAATRSTRSKVAPVVIVTACLLALGIAVPEQAPAGCVGPVIGIGSVPSTPTSSPTGAVVRVPRDRPLHVEGVYFFEGCNDTPGPAPGCGAPQPPEQVPAKKVKLYLSQGARTWLLGTQDASGPDTSWAVAWDVQIPGDAARGQARLSAGNATLSVQLT